MQYLYYKILISCLALQVAVDATVSVLGPMYNTQYGTTMDVRVMNFLNRDATIIDSSIQGQLEYATPPDACSPIADPVFVKTNEKRNMVLINGTAKCSFMTKVKNAWTAGFEAAILFDPFPESFNYSDITFPIERSEIDITVALVSCEDGIILQKFLFPETWKARLFVEILPTSAYQLELYILYGLLSVIGLLVVVVVVFLLVLKVQYKLEKYRNKVQGRVNVDNQSIRPVSESAPLLSSEWSTPNNYSQHSKQLVQFGNC